ncbi:XPC-binding domain-containing protein [Fimicolochytrium jonesii]|uniref:XPC-binding domain-containing protein n=1 Tax=Fimicolochytrium jonesii TaxID=1396493 RepID=UPI0022FF0F40|nr:XPC-binding domain-containing protein [Fimicolochytrium jonesii]KAI8819868.1 XPC-binding domain-containing protein [Fimicolochytrium jonesii]
MKVTVKTLAQKSFQIEIEPSAKISELKQKIQESQGFEVAHQKLIYSGKILDDARTVEEAKIEEKGFIVVMVGKPKPAASASTPAPAAAPATPATPVASAPAPAPAATPATPTPAPQTAAAPAVAATPAGPFDASTLATGSAYESAVQNLVEMGFERTEIVRAMRAAFNNPDRAADYLMNGIPESVQREFAPQAAAGAPATGTPATPAALASTPATAGAPVPGDGGQYINLFDAAAQAAQQPGGGAPGGGAGAGGFGDLSALRNAPQFQQLRQMVQTQPQLLQPLLQHLAQSNPQLMQTITQNQDAFYQMLMEGGEGEGGEAGEEGGAPGGRQYISVTPEEEAAINRLVGLGFERGLAIEAFFACDKNEELAANYLFDQGAGDDWQ